MKALIISHQNFWNFAVHGKQPMILLVTSLQYELLSGGQQPLWSVYQTRAQRDLHGSVFCLQLGLPWVLKLWEGTAGFAVHLHQSLRGKQ